MNFLVDTNICIYALKQNPIVLERLLEQKPVDVGLSVITEAELRTGAAKSTSPTRTARLLEIFSARSRFSTSCLRTRSRTSSSAPSSSAPARR